MNYVTINTHRGLYHYNHLPFRIASAPALFQKLMDTALQEIPHVICYIDDILVTGANNAELSLEFSICAVPVAALWISVEER